MRKLFSILLIAALIMLVSCGGGKKSEESCPEGYYWAGTECVSDGSGESTVTDTDTQSDGGDTADDSDPDTDTEHNDSETSDYAGECTEIRSGGTYEINVETKKLTVGEITVNGSAAGDDVYGEIWAENKETLDEFKVGDIAGLSGKTMNFPKGRYNFAFRPVSSASKVVISENIDLMSGDKTLDFDLPLYHLRGKVVNNSDAVFTVDSDYQTDTKLTLKTGTFEKEIPYSEFSSFDILLPKGKYSVYFKGQLASGQRIFEGTVLSSSQGIVIDKDADKDIKVGTRTFSGSIKKEGYAVSEGMLILVENLPFGPVNGNGIVAADLSSASSYNIAVTTGADLNLVYLPTADSYPVRYITIETWKAETESSSSHDITLDFGRVHGKITFLGGNGFPTVSNCTGADCTIGKLKAVGLDSSSFVVKNFGTGLETDDEGNVTYEALLIRKNPYTEQPKSYSMNFESFLNDVKGIFTGLPFTVPATYKNDEGKTVSSFFFSETETDKEIDLNVTPGKVEGKITLNGSTSKTDESDFIKLKDENGTEYTVVNFSEISDGKFSFYAPKGTYDVLYDGKGILSTAFKTYIERDFEIGSGENNHDFAIKTGKITLDFNVNGTPFADWVKAQKSLESVGLALNIDKTASDFVLDLTSKNGKYAAEVLLGSTINAYLELVFADKVASEKSYTRIPLLNSYNMTSGTTVNNDLTLIDFSISVKLNGKAVKASDYAAKFRLQGTNSSEIYCPAEVSVGAFFKKGEYTTPTPELYLNDGFDTKQGIALNCIYFGE